MFNKQKIISACLHTGIQAQQLTATLNEMGKDGWHLQQVTTLLSKKGGAIYVLKDAYYTDTYYLILEKTGTKYSYYCEKRNRDRDTEKDTSALNVLIADQNNKGFQLVQLLHATAISVNEERSAHGTIAHIMIFENEDKIMNKDEFLKYIGEFAKSKCFPDLDENIMEVVFEKIETTSILIDIYKKLKEDNPKINNEIKKQIRKDIGKCISRGRKKPERTKLTNSVTILSRPIEVIQLTGLNTDPFYE